MEHHKILSNYKVWCGQCPSDQYVDFLGIFTPKWFWTGKRMDEVSENQYVETTYPDFEEEYFEIIDLLEAIECAGEKFTMIELGAGFGRWSVKAIKAAELNRKQCKVTALEAEPAHYEMMFMHFHENGINPKEHQLLHLAVSARNESVNFIIGHADVWYGQAIVPEGYVNCQMEYPDAEVVKIDAVTLDSLIEKDEIIDLIDMDIQGVEYDVLAPVIDLLDKSVKRIHIGTHGAEIEENLRNLFSSHGWIKKYDFECGKRMMTEYGEVEFCDGVQTWINPRLQLV